MAEDRTDIPAKGPTAPYPAFSTLKTLIKPFKEHGAPNKIDRSVLTSFSGAVGSQVLTMLKFLRLIDEEGRPTLRMQGLIEAYDSEAWPATLAGVIREAYHPLFRINLHTATPKEFSEEFRKAYPAADEVSRKSMTFFLNAAREAQINISPYIMKNKKPRTALTKRRAAKVANGNGGADPAAHQTNNVFTPPPAAARTPYEVLMHDIYDPKVMKPNSDEEKAVFTLARFLRSQETAG